MLGVGYEILLAQKMKKLMCHTEKLGSTLEFMSTHTHVPGDEDDWPGNDH